MGMLHLFGNSFDHSNTGKNKIYIPVHKSNRQVAPE